MSVDTMFLLGAGFSIGWHFCHDPPQAEASQFSGFATSAVG
jgi:hypothetical protein